MSLKCFQLADLLDSCSFGYSVTFISYLHGLSSKQSNCPTCRQQVSKEAPSCLEVFSVYLSAVTASPSTTHNHFKGFMAQFFDSPVLKRLGRFTVDPGYDAAKEIYV